MANATARGGRIRKPPAPFQRFIVGECSKTWDDTLPQDGTLHMGRIISQMFEQMIAANRGRGYELNSWQFQTAVVVATIGEEPIQQRVQYIETIVAVFQHTEYLKPRA